MSSYYNRVIGSLAPTEIARSEDINLMQSNTQTALQEMIRDICGAGCIIGGGEEDLKLTPTPDHTDQENMNYEDEADFISFQDRYLRQSILIEKSEIQSIRVQMMNLSEYEPTVFAEIRDTDFNLIKETNAKLTVSEDPIDMIFTFNLNHLPLGEYYFIIRPVDMSASDGTIDFESFKVRYDKGGNYHEGLDVSYDGVNYLPAIQLEIIDQVEGTDIYVTDYGNNFDLFFEHIYSAGNTYTINPAPCIVMGEKVYPIDTHVTIDGPSPQGDRIDLVTLNTKGELNVTQGLPYTGAKTKANYPINNTGLKVAYITVYKNSNVQWVCPNCGTVNDGSIENCVTCSEIANTRIPLIEQGDENNITRQRDILERLRRLEKKLNYQVENNSPSRFKYTCNVDPIMAIDAEYVVQTDSNNNQLKDANGNVIKKIKYAEDSYGINATTNEKGETILTMNRGADSDSKAWSIIDQIKTVTVNSVKTPATLRGYDLNIPVNKPSKVKPKDHYYYVTVTSQKRTLTKEGKKKTEVKKTSGVVTQSVKEYEYKGIKEVPLTITIKSKKTSKVLHTIKTETNSEGVVHINMWQYRLKAGTYKVTTSYDDTKIVNTLKIYSNDNFKAATKSQKKKIQILESQTVSSTSTVPKNVITGNDSFYRDKVTVDTDNGEVSIEKITNADAYKNENNIDAKSLKKIKSINVEYKINSTNNSMQSEYPMLTFNVDEDCTIKGFTLNIEEFNNIDKYKVVLFKNDKIFNLDSSRSSYTKGISETDLKKSNNTLFPNIYYSPKWVTVKGTKKKSSKVKSNSNEITFDEIDLLKGTYSILIIGALKDKKKDGKIVIKEYDAPEASMYGASCRVKGSSGPSGPTKIYIEGNSLSTKTWLFSLNKKVHKYANQGVLISKSIDLEKNITACKIDANYIIPPGCQIDTYVSNNGGKTYVKANDFNQNVTFNGTGSELRWRIVLKGVEGQTPKLTFDEKKGYAIKITMSTAEKYIGYEDFGRCFATPMLNANTITNTVLKNSNIRNKFEEWEYCRLWMEDEDLSANIDICFAYDNENYKTNTDTKQSAWPKTIFFSQIFSNLTLKDFSQESVDYSNYTADVEPDENNFRFKLETDYISNAGGAGEIVTTPLSALSPGQYEYSYGDITNEDIDMSNFDYGLVTSPVIYAANTPEEDDDGVETSTTKNAGVRLISGPYYQAKYSISNENAVTGEASEDTDSSCVWAADGGDATYDEKACIIGVSFDSGLEITEKYTSIALDVFTNLRDCKETNSETGELELDNNGQPKLMTASADSTKYINDDGFAYIPANTLEVVISLNPYGLIEDDNATYGIAYPITVPLRSCHHEKIDINLADLYGSTIYSIGLRVSTKSDEEGNLYASWHDDKHPSLHAGDILGMGNITLQAYNRRPYTPYIYTGDTSRWNWENLCDADDSQAYVQYKLKGKTATTYNKKYVQMPIKKDVDVTKTYTTTGKTIYSKSGTRLNYNDDDLEKTIKFTRTKNSNRIKTIINNDTTNEYVNTDNADTIVFYLAQGEIGKMFKVNTDLPLTPYDYIDVEYYIEHTNGYKSDREIYKGDIILDLYDTTDTASTSPIESLPLPAWGKVQDEAETNSKTVHAWFKKHTDASTVKSIVLRRENPTGCLPVDLKLHLENIIFYNADMMPALGPQMHVRIYPKNMNSLSNTKIRKFGCIYRIG